MIIIAKDSHKKFINILNGILDMDSNINFREFVD